MYYHTNVDINFDKDDFRKDIKSSDDEYYLKNEEYKSYLPLSKIEFTKDTKKRGGDFINYIILAERVGFEPTVPIKIHTLSKRAL